MAEGLNWGIVGTGAVAGNFAGELAATPGMRVRAVASSRKARAEGFVGRFDGARAFHSVEDMLTMPGIDVVYVASATHLHLAHCLLVLSAGKALVCEKPFTANAAEAAAVIAKAREAKLFAMEAMWTRFNGAVRRMKAEIDSGSLGELSGAVISLGYATMTAAPGEAANPDRSNIRNFGCYAISLAIHLFGPVTGWKAAGRRNAFGLDTDLSLILVHEHINTVIDVSSVVTRTNRIDVFGSGATASIPDAILNAAALHIRPHGRGGVGALLSDMIAPLRLRLPVARRMKKSGIVGEIEDVRRCLHEGRTESPTMPLGDTLRVQTLMDEIAASF